jgi:hypothetical protein
LHDWDLPTKKMLVAKAHDALRFLDRYKREKKRRKK